MKKAVAPPANDAPFGPFRSVDAALAFLQARLVIALRPLEIWLFGSRTRGDHDPLSDFDLLVVLADDHPAAADYAAAAEPVLGCGVPYDIVPVAASVFARVDPDGCDVAAAAKREGRRIYAAPSIRRRERA